MTIETVKLSDLQITGANPRKKFDEEALNGLAASIRQDGLLQNLVVTPVKGKKNKFRIIAGERRYRALKILAGQGVIANDYDVPVDIRADLSKDETLRLATVENVQRENLSPLEEARAFAKLIRKGDSLAEIAAQTGLTERTIKRRCALNGLCDEARDALNENRLSLAQAEALSIGSMEAQQKIVENLCKGWDYTPDEIREGFTDDLPSVAMAVFPLSEYKGGFFTDLFADVETTYFEDAEQFMELQRRGVAALKDYFYASTPAKWVDIAEDYALRTWKYEDAAEGEPYGVVINLSPHGEVEYREYLSRPDIDEQTKEALSEKPKKDKPPYGKPQIGYIAHHKSMAVQAALLSDERKIRELAALDTLRRFSPHKCLAYLSGLPEPQGAYHAIEEKAAEIMAILGLEPDSEKPAWQVFSYGKPDTEELYPLIKTLSDDDLNRLVGFATVLDFGQCFCDRFDSHDDSLFNMVANDLGVAMREHWTPCETFLSGRNKEQLAVISGECGYNSPGTAASYKKGELVNALLRHFHLAGESGEPSERYRMALSWLPGVMRFPAVIDDRRPEGAGANEDEDEAEDAQPDEYDAYEDEDDFEYREAAE